MEGNEHVELELPTKETVPGSYMVDGYQTENKQPETNAANAIYEHLLASPALQHPVHSAPDIEPSPPSIVEPGHGQDESTSQSRNVPYFTEENSWIRPPASPSANGFYFKLIPDLPRGWLTQWDRKTRRY
jgi:hypothetical protein